MMLPRSEKGSTLVEVLIAVAISSWLAIGLLTIYSSASKGYAVLGAAADCQYTARSAMEQIAADIRTAVHVQVSPDGTLLDISAPDQSVRFYTQNGRLYRRVSTSRGTTAIPIADNVSALGFSGGGGLVVITLTITGGECTRSLTTAVMSRL